MPVTWINDGEPVNGVVTAMINLEDGSQQKFKGASYKEVAEQLATAQENASRAIKTLRAGMQIEPAHPRKNRATPKPMTAGERLTVAAELQDPAKADKAVTRIVEATVGPIDVIREAINSRDDEDEAAEAQAAAETFRANTPDWYPSAHNLETLTEYMRNMNIAPTVNNFSIAFDKLRAARLLQARPQETEPTQEGEPERIAPQSERIAPQPATRPRGTMLTTGIRASDTSGHGPVAPRPRYTKADIEKMSNETYRQKVTSEPGFAALVDALYK